MNTKCPFTGEAIHLTQPNPSVMEYSYETGKTGRVRISDEAFMSASDLSKEEKEIIVGICRNKNIEKDNSFVVMSSLFKNLLNQHIPYSFEEKSKHFLQYLYNNGGQFYKPTNINSDNDAAISYSSRQEFENLIYYLEKDGNIDIGNTTPTKGTHLYNDVRLTKKGVQEIQKKTTNLPLFGLINQELKSGDSDVDKNVALAKNLFFGEHSTFESKRSACETLSFILEPLRGDLSKTLSGDTETFFGIVNNFTIRHNREKTKSLQHEEQLEWIFYSLLNTLIIYLKMKRKLQ